VREAQQSKACICKGVGLRTLSPTYEDHILNDKYQKLMVYPNKITQAILKHKFPITITLIVTLIALIGSDANHWLRFDRDALLNGEVWRLISGHFAHLN